MASKQNSISFYLNILEGSGKTIVDTYVSDIRKHLNELGLKHTFDIITDEDFYVNTMTGGAKNTFPYLYFENAMNSMRDILPGANRKSKPVKHIPIPDTNYDDITITPESKEIEETEETEETKETKETKEIEETKETDDKKITNDEVDISIKNKLITSLLSYNPVDIDNMLSNDKSKSRTKSNDVMLSIPDNYNGIMHILLTINVKNTGDFISGGITQLNQFLEKYNKKEDD